MKYFTFPLLLSLLMIGACTKKHEQALDTTMKNYMGRFKVFASEVPKEFEQSAAWNKKGICPKESELLPLMVYESVGNEFPENPGKIYYGRKCAKVTKSEDSEESAGRGLASSDEGSIIAGSVIEVPHGKSAFWNEKGKLIEVTEFFDGSTGTH